MFHTILYLSKTEIKQKKEMIKKMAEKEKMTMKEILAKMKPEVDKEMHDAMDRDPNSMKNILKRGGRI